MVRRALGKGLGALIPTHLQDLDAADRGSISEIPVSRVRPNPYQPRTVFAAEELKSLADSIKAQGVLQPILVHQDKGLYILVSGERRLRAVESLGYQTIPAVVKTKVSKEEMLEWSIIENVQRSNLNPVEEAQGYKRLIDEFKLSQEEVAAKVGKDRATVANVVRLLKLPKEVQDLIFRGELSMGHARALLAIERVEAQKALARRAAREGWSVRQVEKVAAFKAKGASRPKGAKPRGSASSELAAFEEKLRRKFATRVRIRPGKKGGAIEIEYYSGEELERLLEILV